MVWVIWASVAFLIVAVAGSIGYAVTRAWRLWKTFRALLDASAHDMARVSASAAAAEQRATSLSRHAARLQAATGRLQDALAELAVLQDALAEARAGLAVVRGVVPRK
jgi:hypothetical protein